MTNMSDIWDAFNDIFGDLIPKPTSSVSKLSYKIYQENSVWRWWTKIPLYDVHIVSTKSFSSKEAANSNMLEVFEKFGLIMKRRNE